MKEGLPGDRLGLVVAERVEEASPHVRAGLDLSRDRLDVCLLSDDGELVEQTAALPDVDGLRGLAGRVAGRGERLRAVIESMTGARFVHDRLEELG